MIISETEIPQTIEEWLRTTGRVLCARHEPPAAGTFTLSHCGPNNKKVSPVQYTCELSLRRGPGTCILLPLGTSSPCKTHPSFHRNEVFYSKKPMTFSLHEKIDRVTSQNVRAHTSGTFEQVLPSLRQASWNPSSWCSESALPLLYSLPLVR